MMAVAADHGPRQVGKATNLLRIILEGRSLPVPLKHKMIADALMARSSIESWHDSPHTYRAQR